MKISIIFSSLFSLARADVIDHDKVVGYPDSFGEFASKFQPYLQIVTGCVSFPAVDKDGNVSGGLKLGGPENGDCTKSVGQVYSRHMEYKDYCALMYSWYMPKDQSTDLETLAGHRHDWENVIVWLTSCDLDADIKAVSYSYHSTHVTLTSGIPLNGSHPLVEYAQVPFPLDHSMFPTNDVGEMQPGVEWYNLTSASRDALENYDFGAATVPFNNKTFESRVSAFFFEN